MENTDNFNFENLLTDLGGCGFFQILVVTALNFGAVVLSSCVYFMTFGIYNPGWRCADNATTTYSVNASSVFGNTREFADYVTDTCDGFDACANVEFNPEASTIVTEWGLVCSKAWIPRLMISVTTIGAIISFPLAGYFADKYGRKRTLQIALFLQLVVNVTSIFSVSWQMYFALCLFGGLVSFSAPIVRVLMTEFVVPKWRLRVVSLPSWCLAITCVAIVAMIFKSWRAVRIYIAILTLVAFILIFWVPKSMRWLSVKGQCDKVKKVTHKIARYNRREDPEDEFVKSLVEKDQHEKSDSTSFKELVNIIRKGYGMPTFVISISFITTEMVYFAITFGISALPGDAFENMIILAVSELPANPLAMYFGNSCGRKKSLLVFLLLEALVLFAVTVIDVVGSGDLKVFGILAMVILAKIILNVTYFILVTVSMEIYPTVIRTTMTGFLNVMAALGQLVSPYAMPNDPTVLYINYLAMGALTLFCSAMVCFLPETKGKTLENTFGNRHLDSEDPVPTTITTKPRRESQQK